MKKEQLNLIKRMYDEVQYYHKIIQSWYADEIKIADFGKYEMVNHDIGDIIEEIKADSKRALFYEDDSKYWGWLEQSVNELEELNYAFAHCFVLKK